MSVTVSTETVPLEVFCKVSYPRPGRGARTLPCRRASQPDLLSRLCPGDGEPWSPTRPAPHQPRTSHVTDGRPGGGRWEAGSPGSSRSLLTFHFLEGTVTQRSADTPLWLLPLEAG